VIQTTAKAELLLQGVLAGRRHLQFSGQSRAAWLAGAVVWMPEDASSHAL
jgi:hypothetical protein